MAAQFYRASDTLFLKRHPANVTVYIDGIAASAATIIAMAGDKIIIPANAMMMIHNPWTLAAGDSEELRSIAEMMDKVRNSIRPLIVKNGAF
ncbi:ATP-dependent Clp protease proteolytic subunit [Salmonella enterica]|uniref:ATP-dependent Clp protease proteolytic subunit n=1 Tax=Salmonella enterica TaxID=28901 RepID=UPI001F062F52|nr:ATP-dependent Clp protease proteolytic subunit [Salmonella enterica]